MPGKQSSCASDSRLGGLLTVFKGQNVGHQTGRLLLDSAQLVCLLELVAGSEISAHQPVILAA